MKQICVIVCNSGRGHIKRVLSILKLLYEKYPGLAVSDVFLDKSVLKSFKGIVKYFKDNKFRIVKDRETFKDLMRGERVYD